MYAMFTRALGIPVIYECIIIVNVSSAERFYSTVLYVPVFFFNKKSVLFVLQHPLVYKLSSAWDSFTAESDEGIGVRELRRLDPSFSVEDWKRDIQELFLPEFMSAFLRVSLTITPRIAIYT